MNKPKSSSLFHFTKDLEVLKSIIANGFYPRYSQEDISWLEFEHVAYPIVCFCDIPLSRIREHTDFYGSYGIGLTKEWGLKNKLNPVIYCPNNGLVSELADYIASTNDGDSEQDEKLREEAFWKLVKLVKPLSGQMIVSGKPVEKDFYQESEWRYTPEEEIGEHLLFLKDFEDKKQKKNKEAENFKIQFSPNDIKYIFVKSDSDIPQVVDHINDKLAQYPLNDLKILNSRILSLSTIDDDL